MKILLQKSVFFLFVFLLIVGFRPTSFAQPTVLGTQLVNGNYVTYDLNIIGGFRQIRLQAASNAAVSTRNWEFASGTAASTNYSTNWRPFTANNTLSSNTFIPTSFDNGARYNTGSGGASGLLPAITNGNYYTFNVGNNNLSSNVMQLLETNFNPVGVSSVTQSPTSPNVFNNQAVVVTVTTSSAPATGENVFLRYTTDAYANSILVPFSFTGNTGTATIPVQPAATNVSYYIYGSNKSLSAINTDVTNNGQVAHDMSTLNLNNNSGSNYNYSVQDCVIPTSFTVTGGGTRCSSSAGLVVGLSGSQTGVSYQLKIDNVNTGSPIPGTGAPLAFPAQTAAGTYTIEAINDNACTSLLMTGSVVIAVLPGGTVTNTNTGNTYCSVQAAIDDPLTLNGHTLVASAGTYAENITINKNLTINGPNAGIAGNGIRSAEAIIENSKVSIPGGNTVVFDGFKIYQTNTTTPVSLGSGAIATIQNNIIERFGIVTGSTVRGIEISPGTGAKIIGNNLITGDASGGFFGGHKTWNNGMFVNGSPGNSISITNNVFQNCRTALSLDDMAAGILVSGNTFSNSGTYIAFGGTTPTAGIFTLGANEFNTTIPTGGLINLSNVASSFRLDISAGTYGGIAFPSLSLSTLFDLSARTSHMGRPKTTAPFVSNGLVTFKPNNLYAINVPAIPFADNLNTALGLAAAGDIINVAAGDFAATSLDFTKSITIRGNNAGIPAAEGTGTIPGGRLPETVITMTNSILNHANNITLDGLHLKRGERVIRNTGVAANGFSLINCLVENTGASPNEMLHFIGSAVRENWSIKNNRFIGIQGGTGAIYFEGAGLLNNIIVEGNDFMGTGASSMFGAASNLTIKGNYFAATHIPAINMNGLNNPTIEDNIVNVNGFGLQLTTSNGGVIRNNTFIGTTAFLSGGNNLMRGIDIFGTAFSGPSSAGLLIENNQFQNFTAGVVNPNDQYRGIHLRQGAEDITIKGNTFTNSHTALGIVSATPAVQGIIMNENDLEGAVLGVINGSANVVDATCNWWGSVDQAVIATRVTGNVTFLSALANNNLVTPSCTVVAISPVRVYSDPAETNLISSHATIQSAISAVTTVPGYFVRVDAGTYSETVTVNKSLTIRGANSGVNANAPTDITLINAARSSESILSTTNVKVSAQNVTIDGFKFTGAGGINTNGVGANAADGLTIINNVFENVSLSAYSNNAGATAQADLEFSNNRVTGSNAAGISAMNPWNGISNMTINANYFAGFERGVQFDNVSNITLSNSYFTNISLQGVQVANTCSNVNITANVFDNCNTVSEPDRGAIRLYHNVTGDINISNNIFTNNYNAIRIRSASPFTHGFFKVNNNSFTSNTRAISDGTTGSTGFVDGTCNWFGSADPATVATTILGNVTFTPFLVDGTDGNSAIGFQPEPGTCTGDFPVFVYSDLAETNLVAKYVTIQSAIDAATTLDGYVVRAMAGTFVENVVVNKRLKIVGSGNTTIVQGVGGTGNIFTYQAPASGSDASTKASLESMKLTAGQRGISASQLVNHLKIENVTFEATSVYGIHINNTSGTMLDWEISNSVFTDITGAGIQMGTASGVNGFTVANTTFNNNSSGAIYSGQSSTNPGVLDNVSITGSTFTSNGNANNQSAIFFEKLSNAIISGNTFTNNGINTNPRAVLVNLKYGNYTTINIAENTIMENRGGTQTNGYGINVQARNDAPSYNAIPATLTTLSIAENEIEGFFRGIEVTNAVDWNSTSILNNKIDNCENGILGVIYGAGNMANTGTTMEVHENSITNAVNAVVNINSNGGLINATCNWFGTADQSQLAALNVGNVTFLPYLLDGNDGNAAIGFQPTGICALTQLYVNDNNLTGDVYTTAVGNDANPGTPSAPFATIAQALSVAAPGNTIFVDAGEYPEVVNIGKSITLLGSNASTSPNVDGNPSSVNPSRVAESIIKSITTSGATILSGANDLNVVIKGFTIDRGNGTANSARFMDLINRTGNVWTYENNIFQNAPSTINGYFYLTGTTTGMDFTFNQNRFTNNGNSNGLAFWGSNPTLVSITNNVWYNNSGWGMNSNSIQGTISGNSFVEDRISVADIPNSSNYQNGVLFANANNNIALTANVFSKVHIGLYLYRFGVGFSGTVNATQNIFDQAFQNAVRVLAGDAVPDVTNVSFNNNALLNGSIIDATGQPTPLNATCNWYDSEIPTVVATKILGNVTFLPYLVDGTDTDPLAIGFQPASGTCIGDFPVKVYSDPAFTLLVNKHPTIQSAIDAVTTLNGYFVVVDPGTYVEAVDINKPNLTLVSTGGRDVTFIQSPPVTPPLDGITGVRIQGNMGTVTVEGFTVRGFAQGILQGLNASGTISIVKNNRVLPLDNNGQPYLRNGIQVRGDGSQVTGNEVVGAPYNSSFSSTAIGVVNGSNILVQNNVVIGDAGIGVGVLNWNNTAGIENITVENNNISGAKNGIRISGQNQTRVVKNVAINANTVAGGPTNGLGISVQTVSLEGLSVSNNKITGHTEAGVGFSSSNVTLTGAIVIEENDLSNNSVHAIFNGTSHSITATCNWYGSAVAATVQPLISGLVNFIPFLVDGTDADLLAIGFQPISGSCSGDFPITLKPDLTSAIVIPSITFAPEEVKNVVLSVVELQNIATAPGSATFVLEVPNGFEMEAYDNSLTSIIPAGGSSRPVNNTQISEISRFGNTIVFRMNAGVSINALSFKSIGVRIKRTTATPSAISRLSFGISFDATGSDYDSFVGNNTFSQLLNSQN